MDDDGCNLPKILGGKSWEGCKFEAPNLDHCFICRFTPLEMDFKQPDTLSLSSSPPKKRKRVILHMDEASPIDGKQLEIRKDKNDQ